MAGNDFMKYLFLLIILSSCTPYTDQYSIQGRWYRDITTDSEILDFGEDWLLTGIDHGFWIEEISRQPVTYWTGMVNIDGFLYEYKIYGNYLQILGGEYKRETE